MEPNLLNERNNQNIQLFLLSSHKHLAVMVFRTYWISFHCALNKKTKESRERVRERERVIKSNIGREIQ